MKRFQFKVFFTGCITLLIWPFSVSSAETKPLVGSQVAGNMDVASMLFSLLMVLAVIFLSAYLLKRFNVVQQQNNSLKVVSTLVLGNKEKVVVVQVADKQLLLGVTAQQITLLDTLETPLETNIKQPAEFSKTLATFLKKQ
jgi:flagellar protein FliO/FliZ